MRNLWNKIHQPRVISVLLFFQYIILLGVGIHSIVEPPASISGEVGVAAMYSLAVLLAFGSLLGVIAALPGIWWLERSAVSSISIAGGLYLWIVLTLHFTQTGNRLLQAGFVAAMLLQQGVRWVRIRERPYRPDNPRPSEV